MPNSPTDNCLRVEFTPPGYRPPAGAHFCSEMLTAWPRTGKSTFHPKDAQRLFRDAKCFWGNAEKVLSVRGREILYNITNIWNLKKPKS